MSQSQSKPSSRQYLDTFQELSDQLQASLGHRLFTVSRVLPNGTEVERIFTTAPQVYPIHGKKTMDQTAWSAGIARGECFVASAPDKFGEHFKDLDTIVSLGLGSVINIPIHAKGRLMGTLNLLDKTGCYLGDVLPICRAANDLAMRGYVEYGQFLHAQTS
jgi:hypothetical protein